MPDGTPENRRDRNERFGEASPPVIVPELGAYLWHWYFDLSDSLERVREYVCRPIPPTEFVAWRDMSGEIVHPSEYAILRAMDAAYCREMNSELAALRERQEEEQRRTAPKATPPRRRGR